MSTTKVFLICLRIDIDIKKVKKSDDGLLLMIIERSKVINKNYGINKVVVEYRLKKWQEEK
jgi:hypothetical protein